MSEKTSVRDKVADIIFDALDQRGLDSYGAADRVLALPEIKEWYDCWWRELLADPDES